VNYTGKVSSALALLMGRQLLSAFISFSILPLYFTFFLYFTSGFGVSLSAVITLSALAPSSPLASLLPPLTLLQQQQQHAAVLCR